MKKIFNLFILICCLIFPKKLIHSSTTHISGYYIDMEKNSNKSKQSVSILAFGDLMLDRGVLYYTKKSANFNYPFLNIDSFLKEADLKVANLEGPITNFDPIEVKNNFQFTFSPNFLQSLSKRFEIFSLSNNHALNFEEEGFQQTKDFLTKFGIKYFGNPKNLKNNLSLIVEKNNIKIGFIGYHVFLFKNPQVIVSEIKKIKAKVDFIIIYPHWGNEYQKEVSDSQKEEARMFIDAGADVIIGSHPHVIQPIELYKNKIIFYSLGNFIFDQYFSDETMEGLSVKILLNKENNNLSASYRLYPIKIIKRYQAELAYNTTNQRILNELSENSELNEKMKQQIKSGVIIIK